PIQALPRSSRSSSHPSFPYVFLRYTPALPRVLHSFPTRRSSDLQVCPPAFHIVEKRFKRHVFMRTCQSDYALVALLRQTVNLILRYRLDDNLTFFGSVQYFSDLSFVD